MNTCTARRIAVTAFLIVAAPVAVAQGAFPSKPLRFVAPFPPGGSSDVICRLLAQKLSGGLGQPVTVENRAGGSSNIGHEIVAKAPADGYTMVLSSNSALTVNPHLYKRLGFDPVADFAPITMIATAAQVLVVHPSVPASNVAELVALAKARPGSLNFGSGGKGIQSHINGEIFKSLTGADIIHVPYKGTIQAVNDLVAGQVQMVFADMVPAMPQIKSGRLRPLAVTSPTRSSVLPGVPTMEESGVHGIFSEVWWAALAPAGTPAAVIERLNAEFARASNDPEVQERYAALGVVGLHSMPEVVSARIRTESPRMAKILQAAGVEPE